MMVWPHGNRLAEYPLFFLAMGILGLFLRRVVFHLRRAKPELYFKPTIFNFSVHSSGARKLPLPGIEDAPALTPVLLRILSTAPVSHFLRLVKGKQGVSVTLRSPSLQEAIAA